MQPGNQLYLTVNGGSSSIKFAMFDADHPQMRRLHGSIERIGLQNPVFAVKGQAADDSSSNVAAPDHASAVALLINWIHNQPSSHRLAAIGHRIVHGGPKYSRQQRVTPNMLADLQAMQSFDPQHLPEEILLIQAFQSAFPAVPQIACFDTAFHHDMPRVAQLLSIPRRFEEFGVRRYGFHGLSYAFLMGELARLAGQEAAQGRIILAHLGNGASLAAVHRGQPVDTSMGFTPASGIMMGTRSGDLDPGLFAWLARTQDMNAAQFDEMANFRSGLLGVSDTSSDMADLLALEAQDVRAAEAVAMFCYQARKCIGAFAAALGGIDQLIFAGGIGEHSAIVRARICEGLGFAGVVIDPMRNANQEPLISADAGRVPVRIIHTDEERMIARAMLEIVGGRSGIVA